VLLGFCVDVLDWLLGFWVDVLFWSGCVAVLPVVEPDWPDWVWVPDVDPVVLEPPLLPLCANATAPARRTANNVILIRFCSLVRNLDDGGTTSI
jgi:hypothetical protein